MKKYDFLKRDVMNEKELKKELDELITYMSGNQVKQRYPIFKKYKKGKVSSFSDCLHTLKVCVKYLVFDLEATKRENKELRKLLRKR